MILWIDKITRPPEGPYIWRESLELAKHTIQTFEQLAYCSRAEAEELVAALEKSGVNKGNIYFYDNTISMIDIARGMNSEYIRLLEWQKAMQKNYPVVTHTSKKKKGFADRLFSGSK